jgi:hypothetical protein
MRNKLIFLLANWIALAAASVFVADMAFAKDIHNDCVAFSTLYDGHNYPGYDWQVLDDSNFVLLVHRTHQLYHVKIDLPMQALSVARQLEFKRNGPWLCDVPPSSVVLVGREPRNISSISSMKHLDEAGIAELEKQYNTKIAPKKKA